MAACLIYFCSSIMWKEKKKKNQPNQQELVLDNSANLIKLFQLESKEKKYVHLLTKALLLTTALFFVEQQWLIHKEMACHLICSKYTIEIHSHFKQLFCFANYGVQLQLFLLGYLMKNCRAVWKSALVSLKMQNSLYSTLTSLNISTSFKENLANCVFSWLYFFFHNIHLLLGLW